MLKYHVVRTSTGVSIILFLLAAAAPVSGFGAPLQVNNQFPPFLGVFSPAFEPAAVGDGFGASLSHSSVYLIDRSAQWAVRLDLELTQLMLRYRADLGQGMGFSADMPLIRPSSGFFDHQLAAYHSTFGFSDYGRSERPMNEFLYDIRKDGAPVIAGVNDRTGAGDFRLGLKKVLWSEESTLSLKADVELPTGSAETGYGNGRPDIATALLLDAPVAETLRLFANAGAVVPGDLMGYQRIGLRNFWYGGAGLEAAVWKTVELIVQCMVQTSPYPATGVREIDGIGVLLAFGVRWQAGLSGFEASFAEDANTAGAPDFTATIAYTQKF